VYHIRVFKRFEALARSISKKQLTLNGRQNNGHAAKRRAKQSLGPLINARRPADSVDDYSSYPADPRGGRLAGFLAISRASILRYPARKEARCLRTIAGNVSASFWEDGGGNLGPPDAGRLRYVECVERTKTLKSYFQTIKNQGPPETAEIGLSR